MLVRYQSFLKESFASIDAAQRAVTNKADTVVCYTGGCWAGWVSESQFFDVPFSTVSTAVARRSFEVLAEIYRLHQNSLVQIPDLKILNYSISRIKRNSSRHPRSSPTVPPRTPELAFSRPGGRGRGEGDRGVGEDGGGG